MNYCSQCGSARIEYTIPQGDNRERHVCRQCGAIFYQNPRIICGVLPTVGDRVLLCKRAIEPRHGYWTLPAGFMENGETTTEAAIRETREEAEADVEIDSLYLIYNLPHINQVYFFFKGRIIDGQFGVGEESLDTQLFHEHEIPWQELAFSTVSQSLSFYFEDKKTGHFPFRVESITHRNHHEK